MTRFAFAALVAAVVALGIVATAWWARTIYEISNGALWGLGLAMFPPLLVVLCLAEMRNKE